MQTVVISLKVSMSEWCFTRTKIHLEELTFVRLLFWRCGQEKVTQVGDGLKWLKYYTLLDFLNIFSLS